jgi:superfamily II DNA or RNA helicase
VDTPEHVDAPDVIDEPYVDVLGGGGLSATPEYPPPSKLEDRAYQTAAIEACLKELARPPGRAILQMACRCGKTRVAHGVISSYLATPRRPACPRILYLVPGLALLRQTVLKLDQYGFDGPPPRILIVGSDERPIPGLRALHPCRGQEVAAGTTETEFIRAECARDAGPPLIVVSTYQSSPLLDDVFDLTVFDECHRLCGDRRARPSTHALLVFERGDRLYITATPCYDTTLSMKDRALFGGIAYAYHMRQGIDAGYVNDFSVALVGRPVAATDPRPTAAADPRPTAAADPRLATAAQICAAFDALDACCGGRGKLLVFCQSIRHATQLCLEVAREVALRGGAAACLLAHSQMPRAAVAASLGQFSVPGGSAILFNCRLFQEGVEIPPLSGVFFAAPRHAPRDIIQSLCRPLNVLPGKPPSKVFIPVTVDPEAAPDSAANLEHFASIIPYFDALVAEDPLLYEHLLDPRGSPYPLHWVNSAVATPAGAALRYRPEELLAAARRSVRRGGAGKTERLLKATNIPWVIGFAELKRIVSECGRYPKTTDCFVYGDAKVNFGHFYRHVRGAYARWKAGEPQALEPHQLRALESLPGWVPYGVEGPYPWRETLGFLDRWLREHNGIPPMVEINKGGYVGLEATPMERLSGTLTCVNQSDGRDRDGRAPGGGFTLEASKQQDLDELCGRWGLRWRKERHPPPLGAPPGAVGSLVENVKKEYCGAKTFIQEAYARFKVEWRERRERSPYIQEWFPQYPAKHTRMERLDVWARRKELVPPRWRARDPQHKARERPAALISGAAD